MGQSRGKFLEWAAYNPVFWNDFQAAAEAINAYYFEGNRDWKEIYAHTWDVLNNCDNIEFNEGEVETYGLLHFLDRYHRFQMIFGRIFARGFFPTPNYPIDVLDIGCGPAPSLFALNDFINILKMFGSLYGNKKLSNLAINLEYLERSKAFLNWISRYQELLNTRVDRDYVIPFHNGSFEEFEGVDFRKAKGDYRQWLIDKIEEDFWHAGEEINADLYVNHIETEWKHKFRYNIIIMSNFLTDKGDIDRFEREIVSAVYALRNYGILVIVSGATPKYEEIISKLNALILKRKYDTKKAAGGLKLALKREKMYHNLRDPYGETLLNMIKRYMARNEFEKLCHPSAKKLFERVLEKGHMNRWYLTVFQKRFAAKI